jgi:hypothetical protein
MKSTLTLREAAFRLAYIYHSHGSRTVQMRTATYVEITGRPFTDCDPQGRCFGGGSGKVEEVLFRRHGILISRYPGRRDMLILLHTNMRQPIMVSMMTAAKAINRIVTDPECGQMVETIDRRRRYGLPPIKGEYVADENDYKTEKV